MLQAAEATAAVAEVPKIVRDSKQCMDNAGGHADSAQSGWCSIGE